MEEREEAEVGLQVPRPIKPKNTTTQAASTEPVPLKCQILGAQNERL